MEVLTMTNRDISWDKWEQSCSYQTIDEINDSYESKYNIFSFFMHGYRFIQTESKCDIYARIKLNLLFLWNKVSNILYLVSIVTAYAKLIFIGDVYFLAVEP